MNVTIEGVEISLTPEQIKKIEEGTKKPSPEQYLIDILNKLTGKLFHGIQVWYLDDQWIFEVNYKNKILWCHYLKVWEKFYHYNDMKDEDIQRLMQTVVCNALNLEGFTLDWSFSYPKGMVCNALNLEGFTPVQSAECRAESVCKALNKG
jgi:hypothetical protein